MYRRVVYLWTGTMLALCVVALLAGPGALSQSQAEETKGGVILDHFRCITVATCNAYNYPLDAPCPKSLPCRTCEFGTRGITNCVQSAGAQCDWRSAKGTECGKERIGTCVSTTFCANLVFYGTFCNNGPRCQS